MKIEEQNGNIVNFSKKQGPQMALWFVHQTAVSEVICKVSESYNYFWKCPICLAKWRIVHGYGEFLQKFESSYFCELEVKSPVI